MANVLLCVVLYKTYYILMEESAKEEAKGADLYKVSVKGDQLLRFRPD